jgi:hypothetical protein
MDAANQGIGVGIRIGGTTCYANHMAVFGLPLDDFTDGTNFFDNEATAETTSGTANTDADNGSVTFTNMPAGDYLVWCSVGFDFGGVGREIGWRIDVDGTEPFNVESGSSRGFQVISNTANEETSDCAFFVINLTEGNHTFKVITNASAASVPVDFIQFVAIPTSFFADVAWDTDTTRTQTNGSTFIDTGLTLSGYSSTDPTLLIFCAPCQAEQEVVGRTRVDLDNDGVVTEMDAFGLGSPISVNSGVNNETRPIMNFAVLDSGLTDSITVQMRETLGGAGDGFSFNCQDDDSVGSTSYIAAIRLKRAP